MMMARNVWVMMARLVMMELLMMNWREDMSTWMVTLLLTSLALDPRVQLVVTGIRISVKELSIILLKEKPFKEQSQGKLTFPAVQMVGGKRTGYWLYWDRSDLVLALVMEMEDRWMLMM